MVFCTYCGQPFFRAEHLKRHILTHTDVKPFKCPTCYLSFRRQDLLQRHVLQLHKETDASPSIEIDRNAAFRRPIACTLCAKAKIKCDKSVPSCGQCTSKGLQCEPRTSKHSSDAVYRQAKRQLSAHNQASKRASTSSSSNGSSVQKGTSSMQQVGKSAHEQPQLQARNPVFTTSSPTGPLIPERGVPAVDDDLTLSFDIPKQLDVAEMSHGVVPQFFHHGIRHISPDFTGSKMDQFLGLGTNASELDGEHQYLMQDSMQPSMDFSFVDISNFISPEPGDTNIFNSPTMFPDGAYVSRPPSPPPTSSNHSMPSSAPSSSPARLRGLSIPSALASGYSVQDLEAVIAVQEGWPCFRCNPLSKAAIYPKTGRIYIEGLEYTLNNHDAWQDWTPPAVLQEQDTSTDSTITVEPFRGSTRDKLMVITQSFLCKAREIHGSSSTTTPVSYDRQLPNNPTATGFQGFVILPTPRILEHLLRAYVGRFEPYYPAFPAGILSPAEIMESSNEKASSLLLLLLIAQGAMANPTLESRYLTCGLTEACRISLFDLLEKDVSLAADPTMLRSALLFMNLGVWSGDKWHMDLATSQHGMYISMLRHSGMLSYTEMVSSGTESTKVAWEIWKEYECRNRLVYSWVIVDHELSLFHDTPPKLSITDLNTALPDQEALWRAKTSDEWSQAFEALYGSPKFSSQRNPPSLNDVFRRFMNRDPQILKLNLSPAQLRLLLQPLQALVCHLHQCLSCFFDGGNDRQAQRLMTQLEEVQSLLQQWYMMCSRCVQKGSAVDPVTCAGLITYHLISLNTITFFPDIERFARGEIQQGDFQQSFWARVRCVEEAPRIWFHCGQVVRLARAMPEANRPPWWAGALYRVALIMWATSIANARVQSGSMSMDADATAGSDEAFAIDGLTPEHASIARYLRYQEGLPMLSKRDGELVSLVVPTNPLKHCLEVLDEGEANMRLTEGIKSRLANLLERAKE